ncbi:MAG TPA: hypothetical protein VFS24_02700 [Steroidobacteraceae bacterium]|nr:hypothetical protein [Steroidobacteraceae bacterium]
MGTWLIERGDEMGFLLFLVAWCFLFAIAWPIAVLLLVLLPFVWLISLPFQLAAIVVGAMFALIRAVLFLPARLLGSR